MFFDKTRDDLRRDWLTAWQRHGQQLPLTPLEVQLVDLIAAHPEYHAWLDRGDEALQQDFLPEEGRPNPFLHLSMHMALREQVGTDRPKGIRAVHAKLAARSDAHEAEHHMMEALGRALWEAQRAGRMPDEQLYLEDLQRLASR